MSQQYVKRNQFQIASTFTLGGYGRGIDTTTMLALSQNRMRNADINAVQQISIIDGSGMRLATGRFVNGQFIPGPGMLNPNCPVHGHLAALNRGSGSGSGTGGGECTCNTPAPGDYDTGGGAGNDTDTDPCTDPCQCKTSNNPVRYFDGKIVHSIRDISGNGSLPWGHARSYTNTASFDVEHRNGCRWKVEGLPYLNFFSEFNSVTDPNVLDNDSVQVVMPGGLGTTFAKSGDGYAAKANGSATFRHRPEIQAYEFRRPSGEIAIFNDFADETAARGCLREMTAPDGARLAVAYNVDKSVDRMLRTATDGEQEILEEMVYDYLVCADDIARIATITLRRSIDDGTTWRELKRVEYTYYRGNEFHGSLGDLKCAVHKIKDGDDWIEDGTWYYRYYKEGETNGFAHGLKFILEPAEYAKFTAIMTLDAVDSQIAPYATNYFEYDTAQRVKRELVDGGKPVSVFAYSEGVSGGDPNHWNLKTTETRPDGSVKIVYTNADGQVLLTDERPSPGATGQAVVNHYVYDADGNQIQHNTPEAIANYQEYGYYGYNSELTVNLHADEGLIEKTTFYRNVAGQPDGKKFREIVKRGNYGTEIVTAEYEYLIHAVSEAGGIVRTEHHPARVTRFADEAMREPVTTRFEYEFQSGERHLQILERKTILPVVSTEENGTGEEVDTLERFDEANRVVWSRDELGSVTYHRYDPVRGLRTKTIQDADLSRTADFDEPVPEGWTGSPNAVHTVSEFKYDAEGRLSETLGPAVEAIDGNGNLVRVRPAGWAVYDDVHRTVRSASGAVTLDDDGEIVATTLVNPVTITMRDIAGNVTDQITAFRSSTDGALAATDVFPRENRITWEKTLYSFGKAIAKRQYHVIPVTGDGIAGENYAETTFGYDACRRQNKIVAPNGTIARTVFDWNGNAVQNWVGTNDAGATDAAPKSALSENDMVLVSENEYGGASSCSSCCGAKGEIRVAVQHVDDETLRVTEYGYDWRGRRTHTFYDEDAQGDYTYDVACYDNLGRAVKQEKYLLTPNHESPPPGGNNGGGNGYYGGYYENDYYDGHPGNPEPEKTPFATVIAENRMDDDRLLARVERFYDARGQVYRTENAVVDPATGIVQGTLVSQSRYDAKGRVVKSREAGQTTVTENTFDTLGRQTASRVVGLDGTVLQQSETVFDANGNTVFAIQAERTLDALGTGPLSLEAEPKGEFRHAGYWYDIFGRQIAVADFGVAKTPSDLPACIASRSLAEKLRKLIERLGRGIDVARREFTAVAEALAPLAPLAKTPTAAQTINDAASVLERENLDGPELVLIQLRELLDALRADLLVPEASDDILVTRTIYDANTGRAVATVDPAGRENRTVYDNLGRVVRTVANVVANGTGTDQNVTVEYSHSLTGRILTLTALNAATGNQTTQYVYDGLDRLVREIYPDSENALDDDVAFGYNRLGERVSKRDQNGSLHEYAYDNFGRLLADTVTTLGNGVDGIVRKIATRYDVVGNIESITSYDGEGTVVNQVVYQYDQNGQLSREYQSHDGAVDVQATPFVGYEYGPLENGLRLTAQIYPSGKRVAYEYDDYGRVEYILDGDDVLVEYGYSGSGVALRTKYVQPNLTLNYTVPGALDRFGRIADHAWKNGSDDDVVHISHGYSRSGSRLYRRDMVLQNADELYTYDQLDQVIGRRRGGLGANFDSILLQSKNFEEKFTFDPTGNWTNFKQDTNGDGTWNLDQDRAHNAANETLAVAGNANILAHDRNGNTIRMPKPDVWDEGMDCVYDAWNRMVEVVGLARYSYDGRNHRIEKIVGTMATKSFFSQNWQELESQNGSEITAYVWGLRYIDDLVCRDRGNERLYSLADPNWNVVALADPTGTALERYCYSTFGVPVVFGGNLTLKTESAYAWNRTFTGQVYDNETGLMLYRNRFYHSELGRFAQRDPIGYETDEYNLYSYVLNSSITNTDPEGLSPQAIACVTACAGCAACLGPAVIICRGQKDYCDYAECLHLAYTGSPDLHQWACAGVCEGCFLCGVGRVLRGIPRRPPSPPKTPKPPRRPVKPRPNPLCTPAQHTKYYGVVYAACHTPGLKMSCDEQGLSVEECLVRSALAGACAEARRTYQKKCFRPSDPGWKGHQEQKTQMEKAARKCTEKAILLQAAEHH